MLLLGVVSLASMASTDWIWKEYTIQNNIKAHASPPPPKSILNWRFHVSLEPSHHTKIEVIILWEPYHVNLFLTLSQTFLMPRISGKWSLAMLMSQNRRSHCIKPHILTVPCEVWREGIIVYERTSRSSNTKSLEIVCGPEVTFISWFDTIIVPIIPNSVCYYLEMCSAIAIWREYKIFYPTKSFMLYNLWTTYWTSISENWTFE